VSNQRRFQWRSGRWASAPIQDFWAPGTLAGALDPQIPNLPLEDAPAGGGGINTSASVGGGLTAIAQAVKALTTSTAARAGAAGSAAASKAAATSATARAGGTGADVAAKALTYADDGRLGARAANSAAKAITVSGDARAAAGAIAAAVKGAGSAAQARAGSASAFPPYGAIELLINAETAGASAGAFVDVSRHRRAITVNSVQTERSSAVGVARFGGYGVVAAADPGRTDFDVGTASDWAFLHDGLDKWTIDLQLDFADFNLPRTILDTGGGTTLGVGIWIGVNTARQVLVQVYRGVNSSYVINGAFSALNNHTDYRHLRITCDLSPASDNVALFEDGAARGTLSKTGNAPSTAAPSFALKFFGFGASGANPFRGSADDLRITRGYVLDGAQVQDAAWPTSDAAGTKAVTHTAAARAGVGAVAQSSAAGAVVTSAVARAGGHGVASAAKALTIGDSTARSAPRAQVAAAKAGGTLANAEAGARADGVSAKRANAAAAAAAGSLGDAVATPGGLITASGHGTAGLRGEAVATPGPAAPATGSPGGGVLRPRRQTATPATPARHVVTSASAGARARGQLACRRAATTGAHAAGRSSSGATHGARTGWAQADAMLLAAQQLAEYRFIVSRRP
jgi:hypothetical protein